MYANGRGVPQDDTEAVKWFRKAAEQDYAMVVSVAICPMVFRPLSVRPATQPIHVDRPATGCETLGAGLTHDPCLQALRMSTAALLSVL